jgi:hypothetical protein
MALPLDLVLREQAFIRAHPEWAIYAQQSGGRFVGETSDGSTRHVIAKPSLKALLDRLDEIVAGQ